MKAKWPVTVVVGLAAVLGSTAVLLDQMAAAQSSDSSVAAPAGSAAPSAHGGADPARADAATGGGASGGGSTPAAGTAAAESAAPAGGEVLVPISAPLTGLPVPPPPAPLIRRPLPGTASAQGKIVDGFPADVLPFPDGTAVVSTGISSADGSLQVAADAIVASSPDSVVGHFQQILGPLTFWSEPVPAAGGQQSVRFSRGNDSVTLTTSTTGTGSTRFMLLGILHAADS